MLKKEIKCVVCDKEIENPSKGIFLEFVDDDGVELGKGYYCCSKKHAMKKLMDNGFSPDEAEEKILNDN